jgi:hypothetical protein
MKNKILVFLLSIFLTTSLFAQDWQTAIEPSPGFSSVNEAAGLAQQIVDAAGLKPNFKIAEARVPNAMAVMHRGSRYILYNPDFISILTIATGTKWAAISVLAHEIGHHLYASSVNKGDMSMATELEADQFSGFVLRKMGATLAESEAAIKLLGTVEATNTHPGRDDRVNSIALGWNSAGDKAQASTTLVAKAAPVIVPSVSSPISNNTETILPVKYILASVRFNADPGSEYYVTTNFNLVKVEDNKLLMIGKLARSNSKTYPYIIYDSDGTQVYVSVTGDIVTDHGTATGKLSVRG